MVRIKLISAAGLVALVVAACASGNRIALPSDGTPHEGLTKCLQLAEASPDPKRSRSACLSAVPRSYDDR